MSELLIRRSALEAVSCLFRHKAIYVDGVPDGSDEATRGILFHAAAHRYIAHLAANKMTADHDSAMGVLNDVLIEQIAPHHLVDEVTEIFLHRWAPKFELELDAFLSAEEKQGVQGFTWRPDLLYVRPDAIEIVDFKTFYIGMSPEQARQEFQAQFYIWQAMKIWPGWPVYKLTFVFVRLGYQTTVTFTPEDFPALERQVYLRVEILKRARETGVWPATPGEHCRFCRLACPVVDHPLKLPVRVTSRAQGQQLGAEFLARSQERGALTKALAAWCAIDGPLQVNGVEFAHRPTTRNVWPAEPVLQALEQAGVEPGELPRAVIPSAALGKYFRRKALAEIGEAIAPLAITTPGTTFGPKKAGVVEPERDDEGQEDVS
jgi:hypothetical protein